MSSAFDFLLAATSFLGREIVGLDQEHPPAQPRAPRLHDVQDAQELPPIDGLTPLDAREAQLRLRAVTVQPDEVAVAPSARVGARTRS